MAAGALTKQEKERRKALKKICRKALKELKGAKGSGHSQPYSEWLLANFGSAAGYEGGAA